MTEEQINTMAQVVRQSLMEELEARDKRIAALEDTVRHQAVQLASQADDIAHLQETVRALQVSNSGLHQWNIDHSLEHDTERIKLKRRIVELENRLREHGLPVA